MVIFLAEVCAKASNKKGRGETLSYTERKSGECFQRKTIFSVHIETCAIIYPRMAWDAVRLCGKNWETQKDLTWNKYSLQYRKWKNRLTWKTQTVWEPVLRLYLKFPCLWRTRWKSSSCNYCGDFSQVFESSFSKSFYQCQVNSRLVTFLTRQVFLMNLADHDLTKHQITQILTLSTTARNMLTGADKRNPTVQIKQIILRLLYSAQYSA